MCQVLLHWATVYKYKITLSVWKTSLHCDSERQEVCQKIARTKQWSSLGDSSQPSRFHETFLQLLILQSHSDESTGRTTTAKCIRDNWHVPYAFAMCKPSIVDWNLWRALSAEWLLQIIIKQEYTMKQQSNAWQKRPYTVPMYMIYEQSTIAHTWARKVNEQT